MAYKISIVVPVYNVDKYLNECLNSLINQTLKDIEIICINDGSKDNSLKILEQYQKKDERIKVINQDNLGVSIARNNGIKLAKGDYIGFVDGDDTVDLNYFEKLYNSITQNNSDIATATAIRKRKHSQKYRVFYNEEKTYTALEDKIKICNIPKCCYIWNKLYKKDLIANELFKENSYFEDILWLPNVIKKSNQITTTIDTNYYYRYNRNSIVKKNSSKKQTDSYFAKKYIIDFFKENNLKLTEKEKIITKKIYYLFNLPLLKIKELDNIETFILFGLIPVFKKRAKI